MSAIFSLLFMLFIIAAACYVHFKLSGLKSVSDFESVASAKMQARAHRIVATRVEIDLMQHSYNKLAAHDEWLDLAHEYMADYEIQVAEEMKRSRYDAVKAYGGIKLVS